jgi:4'-phosphopantetheinyl transferase
MLAITFFLRQALVSAAADLSSDARDVIEIHWVDLDADFPDVLTAHERERTARFARAPDGRRWAAGRAALRTRLGERLGCAPQAVGITHGPHGKPAASGVRFNLSHAGGLALIALTAERDVGVDLERLDRRSAAVERALTDGERASLGAGDRHVALLRTWCRKEALAKAAGTGLGWAPERFDTSAPGAFRLADLDAPAGYVAALAVAGTEPYSISPRRIPSATAAARSDTPRRS